MLMTDSNLLKLNSNPPMLNREPLELIDTHCHIHDRSAYDFAISRQQIGKKLLAKNPNIPHLPQDFTPEKLISRANASNVKKMIIVGTSHEDSLAARDFAASHENIFWSYGIHPDEAAECATGDISKNIPDVCPVAIGEVGLDYRNGTKTRDAQIRLFEQMLQLATDNNLPLIFHVREAFDDFFAVLNNFSVQNAVVHSFSDSSENLKKSLDRGFYIGVNGLATFSNLPTPPLERTLLETDAPFLTPVPVRGRVNEPSYVPFVADFLANEHNLPVSDIAKITTKNTETLFGI